MDRKQKNTFDPADNELIARFTTYMVRLANHIEDDLYEHVASGNDAIFSDEMYETVMRRILSDPEKAMQFMRAIASKPTLLHLMQR